MILTHVSDFHIGVDPEREVMAIRCAAKLHEIRPDLIIDTGDMTHGGTIAEYLRYTDIMAGLPLVTIPGNHEDTLTALPVTPRVRAWEQAGCWIVACDARRSSSRWGGGGAEGEFWPADVNAILAGLNACPAGLLPVFACHWPLDMEQGDKAVNYIVDLLGWPRRNQIYVGRSLLPEILKHASLYVFGHRHECRAQRLWYEGAWRLLSNAGSTTEVPHLHLIHYEGGKIVGSEWVTYT